VSSRVSGAEASAFRCRGENRRHRNARFSAAILTCLAGAAVQSPAQETPKYKVDVPVVNILATVHDQSGKIINDLTKDDFILLENGKRQEIQYFSQQNDLPLTLGLLIDTSRSQRRILDDERKASYQFLEQVLRPEKDQAFVIRFDAEAELLQDITSSRRLLEQALNKLQFPSPRRPAAAIPEDSTLQAAELGYGQFGRSQWPRPRLPGGRGGRNPGDRPAPGIGGGTVLFDAVYLGAEEVLKPKEGRKAIILISDGVDQGSQVREADAIEAAHRADTIVYSIRYYDSEAYSGGRGGRGPGMDPGSRGSTALKTLSQETGGKLFEVSKKMTLQEIFSRIQEELRSQYSLGYTPSDPASGEFRQIQLSTTRDRLEVITRTGYYTKRR
jgi:VWFA-related protein